MPSKMLFGTKGKLHIHFASTIYTFRNYNFQDRPIYPAFTSISVKFFVYMHQSFEYINWYSTVHNLIVDIVEQLQRLYLTN